MGCRHRGDPEAQYRLLPAAPPGQPQCGIGRSGIRCSHGCGRICQSHHSGFGACDSDSAGGRHDRLILRFAPAGNQQDRGNSATSRNQNMREFAHRIVHPRPFEYLLVVLIVGSAVWLGMATYAPVLDRYAVGMGLFWLLTLVVLTLEVLLKMVALLPRIDRYFRDGWNVFDFLVVGALIHRRSHRFCHRFNHR